MDEVIYHDPNHELGRRLIEEGFYPVEMRTRDGLESAGIGKVDVPAAEFERVAKILDGHMLDQVVTPITKWVASVLDGYIDENDYVVRGKVELSSTMRGLFGGKKGGVYMLPAVKITLSNGVESWYGPLDGTDRIKRHNGKYYLLFDEGLSAKEFEDEAKRRVPLVDY